MSAPLVLLVDDVPDHIDGYAIALRARGFWVQVHETGGDALDAARRHRPACIVIDERLSDMRGWDLCAAIKRIPDLASIPIIMLAQEVTIEAAQRGVHVGCNAWLTRTSVPDDVARAIEDVIATGASAPRSPEASLVGYGRCVACDSPKIRAGVRVGPAQYFSCGACGLRWRLNAAGSATA